MKMPKCPICGCRMVRIYTRQHEGRMPIGYYCSECNKCKLNNGITLLSGPLYIGLKEIIKGI